MLISFKEAGRGMGESRRRYFAKEDLTNSELSGVEQQTSYMVSSELRRRPGEWRTNRMDTGLGSGSKMARSTDETWPWTCFCHSPENQIKKEKRWEDNIDLSHKREQKESRIKIIYKEKNDSPPVILAGGLARPEMTKKQRLDSFSCQSFSSFWTAKSRSCWDRKDENCCSRTEIRLPCRTSWAWSPDCLRSGLWERYLTTSRLASKRWRTYWYPERAVRWTPSDSRTFKKEKQH